MFSCLDPAYRPTRPPPSWSQCCSGPHPNPGRSHLVVAPTLAAVIERPSLLWRREVADEAVEVAAGTLDPDEASSDRLWPAAFIDEVDQALASFERDVETLDVSADEAIWAVVKRSVLALNGVRGRWENIETSEREELCHYLDDVLTAAGVDVSGVASRRGLSRSDITDEWRDW